MAKSFIADLAAELKSEAEKKKKIKELNDKFNDSKTSYVQKGFKEIENKLKEYISYFEKELPDLRFESTYNPTYISIIMKSKFSLNIHMKDDNSGGLYITLHEGKVTGRRELYSEATEIDKEEPYYKVDETNMKIAIAKTENGNDYLSNDEICEKWFKKLVDKAR